MGPRWRTTFIPLLAAVLAVGIWLCGAQTPRAAKPTVEQVIVVFKTHFDIGYTELADQVVTRYRTSMIDKALDPLQPI